MPPEIMFSKPYFLIRVLGAAEDYAPLFDVATSLYDFNMLYEVIHQALDPNYKPRKFTRYLTFRNRRRIPDEERLQTVLLRVESPPELVVALNAFRLPLTLTALGVFFHYLPQGIDGLSEAFDLLEKIRNRHLNRRLLEAQVRIAERDAREGISDALTPEGGQVLLDEKEATPLVEWASHRLQSGRIRIVRLELEFIDDMEAVTEEDNGNEQE